ncbi:hypothetical protein Zmor_000249 [Zophobas morio]|uniref:Sodium channel protein Nach n=1 Tax=Zophobas morio TaxID=2755281 RepID=A0AA38MNE7_9CUCU|nr:hypothetical protein Zmor_000249 [Zophobas morio]
MTDKIEPVSPKEADKKSAKTNNTNYKTVISGNISEFAESTSIHGIKYFAGEDRTLFQRVFWLIVLCFSIYTCVMLIKLTWQKWDENPIFISFRQTPVNIWEIPFPAVTVCSMYTMNRESNFNFSYCLEGQGKLNWETGNASSFCDQRISDSGYITEYEYANFSDGSKWAEFLVQTSPRKKQVFSGCNWDDKDCEIFSPLVTPWGVCYSFNMLSNDEIFTTNAHQSITHENHYNISNWNIETNYPKTDQAVYPFRSTSAEAFLNFLLKNNFSRVACNSQNYYQIILHHPAELPEDDIEAITVQDNQIHEIVIQPEITFTSDDLKSYSPQRRKCFYAHERKLHFFKIYTLVNCRMECLANYTLKMCGCVPYYLPHNKTTILCAISNYDNIQCSRTAKGSIYDWPKHECSKIMFLEKMGNFESGIWSNQSRASCNCLPSCNTISYNSKFTSKKADANMIAVSFKKTEFIALERQELFGDINFWASCGGLLGLFTGFSVISLAEIIYYFCLKLLHNLGKLMF